MPQKTGVHDGKREAKHQGTRLLRSGEARGRGANVSGGNTNLAEGLNASAIGGSFNDASAELSVVLGGTAITVSTVGSIGPQPPFP